MDLHPNTSYIHTYTQSHKGHAGPRTYSYYNIVKGPRCSRPWISDKGLARRLATTEKPHSLLAGNKVADIRPISSLCKRRKQQPSLLRLPSGHQRRSTITSTWTHEDVGVLAVCRYVSILPICSVYVCTGDSSVSERITVSKPLYSVQRILFRGGGGQKTEISLLMAGLLLLRFDLWLC